MLTLAITVGGETAPVLTSIRGRNPDKVMFFVTDKPDGGSKRLVEGGGSGGRGIAAEAGLGDGAFELVVLAQPDDFASTYRAMRQALLRLRRETPEGKFIADYTGGTKTMSAAMAAAAVHLGWELSLVLGPRSDLNRVKVAGAVCPQPVTPLFLDDLAGQVGLLVNARHYAGARDLVRGALAELVLDASRREGMVRLSTLLHGLALWDQFQYGEAYGDLRQCGAECGPLLPHLARLAEFASSGGCPPYELAVDLVANAEGRALQDRYEDALLRLYRAVELLAQVRLKAEYNQDTGNLDLDHLPSSLRGEFASRGERNKGAITAGLVDAYRILGELGDPLGKVFKDGWERRLRDLLGVRNKAFMVHGFQPLGKDPWSRAHDLVLDFLGQGFSALGLALKVPSPPSWDQMQGLVAE